MPEVVGTEELVGVVRGGNHDEVIEEVDIKDSGGVELSEEVDAEPEEVEKPPQEEAGEAEDDGPFDAPDESPDESDQSSTSSSPSVPQRTTSRTLIQTKRFTFPVLGGDPEYA